MHYNDVPVTSFAALPVRLSMVYVFNEVTLIMYDQLNLVQTQRTQSRMVETQRSLCQGQDTNSVYCEMKGGWSSNSRDGTHSAHTNIGLRIKITGEPLFTTLRAKYRVTMNYRMPPEGRMATIQCKIDHRNTVNGVMHFAIAFHCKFHVSDVHFELYGVDSDKTERFVGDIYLCR